MAGSRDMAIRKLFETIAEEDMTEINIEAFESDISMALGPFHGNLAKTIFIAAKADGFGNKMVDLEHFKLRLNEEDTPLVTIFEWKNAMDQMHATHDLFDTLDIDGNGSIDRDELFAFHVDCRGVDKKSATVLVEMFFKTQDTDKNGSLEWREYAQHVIEFHTGSGKADRGVPVKTIRKWRKRALLVQAARRLFSVLDSNQDGELDPSEYIAYVKAKSGETISEEKATQLMAASDGIVEWADFLRSVSDCPPEFLNEWAQYARYNRDGVTGMLSNTILAVCVVAAAAVATIAVAKYTGQTKSK